MDRSPEPTSGTSRSSKPPPPLSASSPPLYVKRKMASGLRSLVNSAKKLALGPGSEAKVADPTALFPKVDPAVDGEDCDHDCNSCVTHYPKGFSIDEGDDLYGFVKGWSTHVLVATGKSDWVRDVADEKGSVMQAIDKSKVAPSNGVRFFATRVTEKRCKKRARLTGLNSA